MGIIWVSNVLLWIVVVIQAFVLIELLRQVGVLRMRIGDEQAALFVDGEGLDRGTHAPEFRAIDVRTGSTMDSNDVLAPRTLLVFLSTRCQSCRELIPTLNELASE